MPEGSTSISALKDDFNFIPFISGLTETFTSDIDIFITKDNKTCNVIFETID